jgi:predicted chitinase
MYGTAVGYSGAGGGGAGVAVGEAAYPGNLGAMELAAFFKKATPQQKALLKKFIEEKNSRSAWALIKKITGTELVGKEFNEGEYVQVTLDNGEKKYLRTFGKRNKDIINYFRKLGHQVACIDNQCPPSIKEDNLDEGWRDWIAGAALGAGVALSGPAAADVERVQVQKGDTVYSIAKAFSTTPQVIQKLNKLDKNFTVKPGQEIKVPKWPEVKEPEKKKPEKKKSEKKLDVSKTLTGTMHEAILIREANRAGITDPVELAALLSQAAHESHDFKSMVEYGGSLDFKKYDPKYAPKKARALGNTKVGDGARYKGRGYIQLTGRYNYKRAGEALGLPLEAKPELAEKPEIAAKIAVWFWKQRVQPNVNNFDDVRSVTKPINPGLAGLQDRKVAFQDFINFTKSLGRSI